MGNDTAPGLRGGGVLRFARSDEGRRSDRAIQTGSVLAESGQSDEEGRVIKNSSGAEFRQRAYHLRVCGGAYRPFG